MTKHPFVERISIEREIVRKINGHNLVPNSLAGLGIGAIDAWANQFPGGRPILRDVLVDLSAEIRRNSSSSHRGAINNINGGISLSVALEKIEMAIRSPRE